MEASAVGVLHEETFAFRKMAKAREKRGKDSDVYDEEIVDLYSSNG